jgi:hypothetical protein
MGLFTDDGDVPFKLRLTQAGGGLAGSMTRSNDYDTRHGIILNIPKRWSLPCPQALGQITLASKGSSRHVIRRKNGFPQFDRDGSAGAQEFSAR